MDPSQANYCAPAEEIQACDWHAESALLQIEGEAKEEDLQAAVVQSAQESQVHKCKKVCRDKGGFCRPRFADWSIGPTCGLVGAGCFNNEPTRTCALCTMDPSQTNYCCPAADIE